MDLIATKITFVTMTMTSSSVTEQQAVSSPLDACFLFVVFVCARVQGFIHINANNLFNCKDPLYKIIQLVFVMSPNVKPLKLRNSWGSFNSILRIKM